MRIIKVKVWNEKKKEMSIGMDLFMLAGYLTGIYPKLDGEIFLQWTGLTDKNGKEIYEGDVLKGAGIVTWNQDEVRWSCIDIEWNDKKEWHDMLYLTTPLEIIGNIYENPELLKQ